MKQIAFKTNPARMGFRELFRVAGSPGIGILACTLKLFRILGPDNDGYGIRAFGNSLERLELDSLPRRVIRATEGYRAKLQKLGFIPGFAYSLETFGAQEAHGQVFRHKDGSCAVSIAFARCVRGETETETTVFGFNTPLADDSYVMTSGNKRLLNKRTTGWSSTCPGSRRRRSTSGTWTAWRTRSRGRGRSSRTTNWNGSCWSARPRKRSST